ncbi:MAG: YceI family protein [Balneolaceae bacterium]
MKNSFFFLLLFLLGPALQLNIQAQSFMSEEGYAEFISSAPLLEFKGKSNNLAGLIDLDENLVDFYIDLNTLDTGISLRNRHMRDNYLETAKYPYAEFTGKIIGTFDPELAEVQPVRVEGIFKIHGAKRELKIDGTIEPKEEGLFLKANWSVLLENYNIKRPQVIFYELADEQKVSISMLLKPVN